MSPSPSPSRRLSTGGLPPVKIREQTLIDQPPTHTPTPCFSAWVRQEIIRIPPGWSASDYNFPTQRPTYAFHIYATTPRASDPQYLETLAETLYKETREERSGRGDDLDCIDVWGMPLGEGVSEGERVEICREHMEGEIRAREEAGVRGFGGPEVESYVYERAIVIMDREEGSWNEGEGGFLVVYWGVRPSYVERLVKVYGEGYREAEVRVRRCTRDGLGEALGGLRGFY